VTQLCQTCGAVQRTDPDERAAAEIALAHIMALMRKPAGLTLVEQTLRHLQGLRSGAVRVIEMETERAARR